MLRDMINKFVFVYLDDIFNIPSFQVHIWHIKQVLQQLLENQLFVKSESGPFMPSWFCFWAPSFRWRGFTWTLQRWEASLTDSKKSLQQFLGFSNFYCHFIRNFSQVAAPLTALTSSKVEFTWPIAAIHFVVWTDHRNLEYIQSASLPLLTRLLLTLFCLRAVWWVRSPGK